MMTCLSKDENFKKTPPQKNQQQQKGKKLPSRERLSKIMVLNLNKVQENTEYNCP